MAGWHHWLDGRESEWTPGDGDGQGGLAWCNSWGHKELDTTERLNWTELNYDLLWRRKWQPIPVSLPGKSHGQRSLVCCTPWGRKDSSMTELLTLTYTYLLNHSQHTEENSVKHSPFFSSLLQKGKLLWDSKHNRVKNTWKFSTWCQRRYHNSQM